MSTELATSLENCFDDLADPRVSGRCDHKLLDIIIIPVCGVLCGADSWVGIETVGKAKERAIARSSLMRLPCSISL
jgi:hypothetical protein